MQTFWYILIAVGCYFLGNFTAAYFVSRFLKKEDIREHGSGNAGTANMLRTYGKTAGALTLVLDFAKGVLAVIIGRMVAGDMGAYVAAVAVVVGHDWPVLLGFKGGKGVATSLAALVAIDWRSGLIVAVVGFTIIGVTRKFSIGALAVACVYPFVSIFLYWGDWAKVVTIFVLCTIVVWKHRTNLARLMQGTEMSWK